MGPKSDSKNKKCDICGDVSLGLNFGGLACESCKAFFRRNALLNKSILCRKKDDNCVIDIKSRIKCKKCRLAKCFEIGMRKELITERKNKKDSKNKKKKIVKKKAIPNRNAELSKFEQEQLKHIQLCIAQIELKENFELTGNVRSILEAVNLSAIFMKEFVKLCKTISAFKCLNKEDQLILLRCGFTEIIAIWNAYVYDVQKDGIPMMINETRDKAMFVPFGMSSQLKNKNISVVHRNFTLLMHRAIGSDTKIRDLLILQILFKNRPNIKCMEFINYTKLFYALLLRRYLEHKFRDPQRAKLKCASLSNLLTQLEQVNEATSELFEKELDKTELTQISAELFSLD